MSKKKKRITIILCLVLLLAAASYTVFIAPLLEKEEVHYMEEKVTRGEMIVGVTESGYVEYQIEEITYDLDLEVEEEEDSDEIVQKYLYIEEIYVAEGQIVNNGAPLLKFSDDSISQVRKMLESALVGANVEYNEAEKEYRLALLEAENTLEIQNTEAKYAKEIYNAAGSSVKNNITSLELQIKKCTEKVTTLEEDITEATENYQEAKVKYEEIKAAYDVTGVDNVDSYLIIQNNYSNAQSAYERALSNLEQAKANLEDNAKEMESLQLQLNVAKAQQKIQELETKQNYEEVLLSGENAQYSYRATLESLEQDLAEAEEEKLAMEEKLAEFEELVGTEGILYAPADCKITEADYEKGDTLERAGTLFSYIEAKSMSISVDVTQEDVVSLSVGDSVKLIFTAYEEENYQGTIYSIDTTATSVDTPTISYTVVIRVDGTLEKIFGGMSANVTFVTEEKENTLYISRKALIEENGKTYVYVQSALGSKEKKEVETGIRNESYVEILSGLEENDTIYSISYGDMQ